MYRIRDGVDSSRSLVLKRHRDAGTARRARLVRERWLPVLGLEARCPRVLGTAADRHGRWVWQVYEDLGNETLLARPDRGRLGAAVDLIAELHTRAAGHPLLCQVRAAGADYGMHYFTSALHDADRAPVGAQQLYEWTDDQGRKHFTDNINRVPEQYRSQVTGLGSITATPEQLAREAARRRQDPAQTRRWQTRRDGGDER